MSDSIKGNRIVLGVIWAALLFAILIYAGIALGTSKASAEEETNAMVLPLSIVGAANMVMSLVVFFVKKPKEVTEKNAGTVLTKCVIAWALADAVAIYGLVMAFVGVPPSTYLTFFVVGFLTLLIEAPTFVLRSR